MSLNTKSDEAFLLKMVKEKLPSVELVSVSEVFEAANFKADIIYQRNDIILQIYPNQDKMEILSKSLDKAFEPMKRCEKELIPELDAWWVKLLGYVGNTAAEEAVQECLDDLDQACQGE